MDPVLYGLLAFTIIIAMSSLPFLRFAAAAGATSATTASAGFIAGRTGGKRLVTTAATKTTRSSLLLIFRPQERSNNNAFVTSNFSMIRRSSSSLRSNSNSNIDDDNNKNNDDDDDDDEAQLLKSMLYRIRKVNNVPSDVRAELIEFVVDGKRLGKVTPEMAQTLCSSMVLLESEDDEEDATVFELRSVDDDHNHQNNSNLSGFNGEECKIYLTLTPHTGTTSESRTFAVNQVMQQLRSQGVVTGWRDEWYPVAEGFYEEPVFLMERAAAPFLGIVEYGVHINGLVDTKKKEIMKDDGDDDHGESSSSRSSSSSDSGDDDKTRNDSVQMWIGRRSPSKSKYPGMLDHLVAGGQPANLGLMDNVIKECMEEAGIPEKVTRRGIQAAGAISHEGFHKGKVVREVLFCYDLYLPPTFVPTPVDGEVQEFMLCSMDQVKSFMAEDYPDPIKPNCYPVIIDYLLRAGHISPETPGYLDILRELRSGACR